MGTDCWRVHYGGVQVGTVARRIGCSVDVDPWAGSAVSIPVVTQANIMTE
jgi:hypothetical protein